MVLSGSFYAKKCCTRDGVSGCSALTPSITRRTGACDRRYDRRQTDWTNALSGADVVIHLAARVHVMKDSAADPLEEFLKVNLHGTANLAQQAAHAGVKRLVYVSSIKVNGKQTIEGQAFTELSKPDPQDPYGFSKCEAERALHQVAAESSLEIVTIRPLWYMALKVKVTSRRYLVVLAKGNRCRWLPFTTCAAWSMSTIWWMR